MRDAGMFAIELFKKKSKVFDGQDGKKQRTKQILPLCKSQILTGINTIV